VLESRRLLSAAVLASAPDPTPALLMIRASTADSHGVTVDYRVLSAADAAHPLTFRVYRSSNATLDAGDPLVVTVTPPALDDVGKPSGAPGLHHLTLPLEGGLPPVPRRPYVVVAAGQDQAVATADPQASVSFRVHTLAVITHGGIENPHWKNGPPWELVMARTLREQGYDAVIAFNWVSESSKPGAAARQGVRMARMILDASQQFPAGEPVDLHLIGHSEGAVVISQALKKLGPELPPGLKSGYTTVTLLDPHAANNGGPGRQYSIAHGPLGWVAKGLIDHYQSKAKDPAVVVPSWVDDAQVFYQQTPASRDHGTNDHIYNLWGQVPVRGVSHYFDLTADSVTHSGKTGVAAWYQGHVVPTLGEGAPAVAASELTGAPVNGAVTDSHETSVSGHAAPGSTVRLLASLAADPGALREVGRAVADADGTWSLTTRPLPGGRYRLLARSLPPKNPSPAPAPASFPTIPTAPLGPLVVRATDAL
jgi:hypothetical protein